MSWTVAVVIIVAIIGVTAVVSTVLAIRGGVRTEETKGKFSDRYRKLVDDYEQLVLETRDGQAAMQADLAALREKVDSIEKMMRDVA